MSISFKRYVDITSGVGAGAVVGERELMGRLFTNNPLLPPQSFIQFQSADEVGSYFGTSSEEYLRAVFYFGWVSKNITSPKIISYARWVETAQAPMIFGEALVKIGTTLTALQAVTTGAFALTLGGVTNQITALDFSGAGSLTAIAALIQTAIRTHTGTQWTAATVTYNSTLGGFEFVGGSAVAANVLVAAPSAGTDISSLIGWNVSGVWPNGAVLSDGSLAEAVSDTLIASSAASDNFGSFLFIPALTEDQIIEAATWNNTQNVKFLYCVPVSSSNASSISGDLNSIGGAAMVLSPLSNEYAEMVPMMIEAATDYDALNSVQNYMFQQFNLTPSVASDTDADMYDGLRVNYYGQTQTAGQQISFFQRGYMTGWMVLTNPSFINVYANEQWLKAAAGAAIMQLLLALSQVSANKQGRSQIITILQSVIDQAKNNGTISSGGILSTAQKLYIAQITGDPTAYFQIQTIGYWLDCQIIVVPDSDPVEYEASYTLVYKKDDVINKVVGRHILI